MATRGVPFLPALLLAAAVVVPACSTSTRYRMLTFFFDGVPPPEGEAVPAGQEDGAIGSALSPSEESPRVTERRPLYTHPPFQKNRCDRCHNVKEGKLFKTVEEGLCQMCHTDLPSKMKYVHGPIAVNACLFCHSPHSTPFPKVLHEEARSLCLQCHDEDDVMEGEHHAGIAERGCVECHNPHGGNNRYFLKREEP